MVSVCMAVYNGAKYINEQLDSILNQLSTDDEIIISDDKSTDDTLLIINNYNDPRIKVYQNFGKKGPVGNFENALKNASGTFIFLCDQDDIWQPDKVEKLTAALQNVDLVFSNAKIINNKIEVIGNLYDNSNNCGFFRNLIKNRYVGATMAFRSSLLKRALPFPKRIPMHDQWLGLLAEYYGKTDYISKTLILYRRHEENSSTTGKKSQYGFLRKMQFRFNIFMALLKRIL